MPDVPREAAEGRCHVDLSADGPRRVLCFGCGHEATLPELEAAMDAAGRRHELANALEVALGDNHGD